MAQAKDEPAGPALTLEGEEQTLALAARLARVCRPGDVIALAGDLGAGKTVFARGFITALCPDAGEVPSPTFTLVQPYDGPDFTVYHFDLYRLKDPDEALELDIEDAFADGISLIEWPDRLGPYLPARRLEVRLAHANGETTRRVSLSGPGWASRLNEAGIHG